MKANVLFCCYLLGVVIAVTCPGDTGVNGYASVEGGTTGGGTATAITVTTLADLKTNAGASGSRVIIVKGTIDTGSAINVASDKTIRGYNKSATIIGGFSMNGVSNIIFQNLNIKGGGTVDTMYAWAGATGNLYDDTTGSKDNGYFGSTNAEGQEDFTAGPFTPPYSYTLDDASAVLHLLRIVRGLARE
ncbi:hypothetical protein VE02_05470 [Pseudogymnoascus sp. 03VT05]|nr:hypothetical protein VE02_05470 [Pseudogymnoascus sp. 03VT05]